MFPIFDLFYSTSSTKGDPVSVARKIHKWFCPYLQTVPPVVVSLCSQFLVQSAHFVAKREDSIVGELARILRYKKWQVRTIFGRKFFCLKIFTKHIMHFVMRILQIMVIFLIINCVHQLNMNNFSFQNLHKSIK